MATAPWWRAVRGCLMENSWFFRGVILGTRVSAPESTLWDLTLTVTMAVGMDVLHSTPAEEGERAIPDSVAGRYWTMISSATVVVRSAGSVPGKSLLVVWL